MVKQINIPSFDDFWDQLPAGRIEEWANEANASARDMMPIHPPIDQRSMSEFVTVLSAMNLSMTRSMMSDYHEWLIEELSKKSLRLL